MIENRYPITKSNKTLDPTLSKMLPIGLPLYNGDKKTAIKNGDKKISKKTIQNYKKILEFMEEGKEYTIQDFCNLLNLKPSRTKELLKVLTQDIEQIGNNKNRKYRLK